MAASAIEKYTCFLFIKRFIVWSSTPYERQETGMAKPILMMWTCSPAVYALLRKAVENASRKSLNELVQIEPKTAFQLISEFFIRLTGAVGVAATRQVDEGKGVHETALTADDGDAMENMARTTMDLDPDIVAIEVVINVRKGFSKKEKLRFVSRP